MNQRDTTGGMILLLLVIFILAMISINTYYPDKWGSTKGIEEGYVKCCETIYINNERSEKCTIKNSTEEKNVR